MHKPLISSTKLSCNNKEEDGQQLPYIICAIDSFKGCLTSAQIGQIFIQNFFTSPLSSFFTPLALTVSDGGDGMLSAFSHALSAQLFTLPTHDALMRPITAQIALAPQAIIIESAAACGLSLIATHERNPLSATTYGVGELIAQALPLYEKIYGNNTSSPVSIIIGLGGSATTDGGQGMLQALQHTTIDLQRYHFILASDVKAPLYGHDGAAYVFSAQKGASPSMIEVLDEKLRQWARLSVKKCGKDCSQIPGAGAAGGLGFAFLQYFQAKIQSGAELLLQNLHFDTLLSHSIHVFTGEGSADSQTLMGKLPIKILQHCLSQHVPCHLVAGQIRDNEQLLAAGFSSTQVINPSNLPLSQAIRPEIATQQLSSTFQSYFSLFLKDKI